MQHTNHLCDDCQAFLWDIQPGIECCNELLPDVFPGLIKHVVVRA